MKNYQIWVYKASGEEQFYLADNPILVQQFEGTDYLIPISPKICLGLQSMIIEGDHVLISNEVHQLSDNDVKRINERIIKNADQLLIISTKKDIDFVRAIVAKF